VTTRVVHITPFHVGWSVQSELSGRRGQTTVTGERERAIEIAQYQARRHEASLVVLHHEDGSVAEEFSTV